MEEIWKELDDLPNYEISNMGRLRNKNTLRILKTRISKFGYEHITITYGGEQYFRAIHRLVAKTFLINPDNKPDVNHIDENKLNNNVNNLEWVTKSENINHGTRNERVRKAISNSKTLSIPIIATNLKTGEVQEFYGSRECARQLGLNHSLITNVLKGRRRQTGGYTFKYKED